LRERRVTVVTAVAGYIVLFERKAN